MLRITAFISECIDASEQQFIEDHPEAFVLLDSKTQDVDPEDLLDSDGQGWSLMTKTLKNAGLETLRKIQPAIDSIDDRTQQLFAVPLVKQANNPWKSWVTIGRAKNNDVVVPTASVSKVHAYFVFEQTMQQWFLVDSNSRNGTRINGTIIETNKKHPVNSFDVVTFGTLAMTVYSSRDFYRLVKRLIKLK